MVLEAAVVIIIITHLHHLVVQVLPVRRVKEIVVVIVRDILPVIRGVPVAVVVVPAQQEAAVAEKLVVPVVQDPLVQLQEARSRELVAVVAVVMVRRLPVVVVVVVLELMEVVLPVAAPILVVAVVVVGSIRMVIHIQAAMAALEWLS